MALMTWHYSKILRSGLARSLALLAILLLSAGQPVGLFAQSDAARALIVHVKGEASARIAGDTPAQKLKANSTIPVGAEIRTGQQGAVVVQLSRTLICRIGPASVVRVESLQRLKLANGSVGARADEGGRLEVVTPTAVAGVRGTEFIVESESATEDGESTGSTTVLVNEGTVAVENPAGESQDVEAGNKIISDGESLRLSILEKFEQQKFEILEAFGELKKKNFESFMEQVRRNEELREEMQRIKGD